MIVVSNPNKQIVNKYCQKGSRRIMLAKESEPLEYTAVYKGIKTKESALLATLLSPQTPECLIVFFKSANTN